MLKKNKAQRNYTSSHWKHFTKKSRQIRAESILQKKNQNYCISSKEAQQIKQAVGLSLLKQYRVSNSMA